MNLTKTQSEAHDYLIDNVTTEVFFGGGAGGGKSLLGCAWILESAYAYPGTRYLMGRAVLRALKQSTLLTLFDLFKKANLQAVTHYKYNANESKIVFSNGSEIHLRDLAQTPSDPEFDNLGSTEYTCAYIDEASEITDKAKNIVLSRLRYKHTEFGIIPKLLITSNPCKNFLYYEFYKPYVKGELPKHRKVVLSLGRDNPHLPQDYLVNLERMDQKSKERLLLGNWEYDDDPSKLINYDKIQDLFTNTVEKSESKFITADIARMGNDKTVIYVWEGLKIVDAYELAQKDTKQVIEKITAISTKYQVPRSNIIVDEDGVGGGVKDNMSGIKGFVNNSTPIKSLRKEEINNYANLKSQCYFKLADYINQGKVAIYADFPFKEKLVQDLEQVKQENLDKDQKLRVMSKDKVKEFLGRSPDYSDALMFRMFFELRQYVQPMVAGAKIF